MSDPMALKWAIVDLLKICDAAHEGRLHGDLARIARTLGVELTPLPINPDEALPVGDDIIPQLNLDAVKKYGKKLQGKPAAPEACRAVAQAKAGEGEN